MALRLFERAALAGRTWMPKTQMRHFFSAPRAPGRSLQQMERSAHVHERNATKQAEYLHELNKTNPQAVIKRFESGHFASNDACAREYLVALSKSNRIPELDAAGALAHLVLLSCINTFY